MKATQASVVIVNPAGTRSGPEHAGHLGDVGALAAEQRAHVARALSEVVDVAGRSRGRGHAAILEASRARTCVGATRGPRGWTTDRDGGSDSWRPMAAAAAYSDTVREPHAHTCRHQRLWPHRPRRPARRARARRRPRDRRHQRHRGRRHARPSARLRLGLRALPRPGHRRDGGSDVDGRKIVATAYRDPSELPWASSASTS